MVSERAGAGAAHRRLLPHGLRDLDRGAPGASGLTVPDPERPGRPKLSGERLKDLYVSEGPEIFGDSAAQAALARRAGSPPSTRRRRSRRRSSSASARRACAQALREIVVTAYDMHEPGPHFFKRWRARESTDRDASMVDVGMATSAAPDLLSLARDRRARADRRRRVCGQPGGRGGHRGPEAARRRRPPTWRRASCWSSRWGRASTRSGSSSARCGAGAGSAGSGPATASPR